MGGGAGRHTPPPTSGSSTLVSHGTHTHTHMHILSPSLSDDDSRNKDDNSNDKDYDHNNQRFIGFTATKGYKQYIIIAVGKRAMETGVNKQPVFIIMNVRL